METFDDKIRKLQPITVWDLNKHYIGLLAIAVAKMLQKLGYPENQPFVFEEKKLRTRTNLHLKSSDITSISYSKNTDPELQHHFYMDSPYIFEVRYPEEWEDGEIMENLFIIPESGQPYLEWWFSIYNYLRIELKSSKSKKK